MKRSLIPCSTRTCPNLTLIQIVGDTGLQLSIGNTPKNFLNDRRGLLIDFVTTISTALIPQRQRAVHLALVGVVHQTTHDVFRHVLAVKLVDVHHRAQSETTGCVVSEFFFAIDYVHAVLSQFIFVGQCMEHIAADTIRLIGQYDLEFAFFSRAHHLLKLRTSVRAAGHGTIRVDPNDLIAMLSRIFLAFIYLLFDTGIVLRMAGITGVYRRNQAL